MKASGASLHLLLWACPAPLSTSHPGKQQAPSHRNAQLMLLLCFPHDVLLRSAALALEPCNTLVAELELLLREKLQIGACPCCVGVLDCTCLMLEVAAAH
jgi:hypothetical protein